MDDDLSDLRTAFASVHASLHAAAKTLLRCWYLRQPTAFSGLAARELLEERNPLDRGVDLLADLPEGPERAALQHGYDTLQATAWGLHRFEERFRSKLDALRAAVERCQKATPDATGRVALRVARGPFTVWCVARRGKTFIELARPDAPTVSVHRIAWKVGQWRVGEVPTPLYDAAGFVGAPGLPESRSVRRPADLTPAQRKAWSAIADKDGYQKHWPKGRARAAWERCVERLIALGFVKREGSGYSATREGRDFFGAPPPPAKEGVS